MDSTDKEAIKGYYGRDVTADASGKFGRSLRPRGKLQQQQQQRG